MVNLQVTFNGLMALYDETVDEIARIQRLAVTERSTTDKLALPYLLTNRDRLMSQLVSHHMWAGEKMARRGLDTVSKG